MEHKQRVEDGRLVRRRANVDVLKLSLEFIGWHVRKEENGYITILDQNGATVGWQYYLGKLVQKMQDPKGRVAIVVTFNIADCVVDVVEGRTLIVSAYNDKIVNPANPILDVAVTFTNPDKPVGGN